MAASQSTTRRALIAGAASITPVAAAAAVANLPTIPVQRVNERAETSAETLRRERREFIESIALMHPRGRYVATKAMAMDLNPRDCVHVHLTDHVSGDHHLPLLKFRGQGERYLDWITVGPNFAFQEGPVLR